MGILSFWGAIFLRMASVTCIKTQNAWQDVIAEHGYNSSTQEAAEGQP